MIQDFKFPLKIAPNELDQYLCVGWYRMGQCIFTTDFIEKNGEIFKTIWLRNCLKYYTASSSYHKLENRNKNFRIELAPFQYSKIYESLFQEYRTSLPTERAHDLYGFLFGDSPYIIFNSLAINIYDSDKLIGAGIFDLGEKSAAGISSFYHPAYKKYSIGRFLIYKKMEFCKEKGYDYFYPGYFVPGLKGFDYKLEIGKKSLEYYDMNLGGWKPISEFRLADYR